MPTVVFACKSNSCRSQMAEGWAHQWIKEQIVILGTTLQEVQDKDAAKSTHHIREHLAILEKTIVASVALDSSAVFTSASEVHDVSDTPDNTCCKRKKVKNKAVEAMAKNGIDISFFEPCTIDEVMLFLSKNGHISSTATEESINISDLLLANIPRDEIESEEGTPAKTVDKLVILCSCGDLLKYKLVSVSKSIEEWSIDAPTTASKNGEGDSAYHRVSLEIKQEVNMMMENLLGSPHVEPSGR